MDCKGCKKALLPREIPAYGCWCEDCWAQGKDGFYRNYKSKEKTNEEVRANEHRRRMPDVVLGAEPGVGL